RQRQSMAGQGMAFGEGLECVAEPAAHADPVFGRAFKEVDVIARRSLQRGQQPAPQAEAGAARWQGGWPGRHRRGISVMHSGGAAALALATLAFAALALGIGLGAVVCVLLGGVDETVAVGIDRIERAGLVRMGGVELGARNLAVLVGIDLVDAAAALLRGLV